jgi:hypothetical protein
MHSSQLVEPPLFKTLPKSNRDGPAQNNSRAGCAFFFSLKMGVLSPLRPTRVLLCVFTLPLIHMLNEGRYLRRVIRETFAEKPKPFQLHSGPRRPWVPKELPPWTPPLRRANTSSRWHSSACANDDAKFSATRPEPHCHGSGAHSSCFYHNICMQMRGGTPVFSHYFEVAGSA